MYLLLEHGLLESFESIFLFSSLQCYVAKEWECVWGWGEKETHFLEG